MESMKQMIPTIVIKQYRKLKSDQALQMAQSLFNNWDFYKVMIFSARIRARYEAILVKDPNKASKKFSGYARNMIALLAELMKVIAL